MNVSLRIESARGCGYRKPGGIYLVAGGLSAPCGKLPIPLDVCPTCSHGIKPSRGWTWINGTALAAAAVCSAGACHSCPLGYFEGRKQGAKAPGRVGLLWIGEQFYATPQDWIREAGRMGISRRLSKIPKGFELHKTWVWVAHRRAIRNADGTFAAGVFQVFKPTAIEYVVTGRETDDELEAMRKRGWTPVQVKRDTEVQPLFDPRV